MFTYSSLRLFISQREECAIVLILFFESFLQYYFEILVTNNKFCVVNILHTVRIQHSNKAFGTKYFIYMIPCPKFLSQWL